MRAAGGRTGGAGEAEGEKGLGVAIWEVGGRAEARAGGSATGWEERAAGTAAGENKGENQSMVKDPQKPLIPLRDSQTQFRPISSARGRGGLQGSRERYVHFHPPPYLTQSSPPCLPLPPPPAPGRFIPTDPIPPASSTLTLPHCHTNTNISPPRTGKWCCSHCAHTRSSRSRYSSASRYRTARDTDCWPVVGRGEQ